MLFSLKRLNALFFDVVRLFVCDFLQQGHFEEEDVEKEDVAREEFNSMVRFYFASVLGHQIGKK